MTLEERFERDIYEGYELLKRECHYNAIYFLQMVREHGGVGAARRLLTSQDFQAGLIRLWEERRLTNSLENAVCQRKYRALFTANEIRTARKRLRDLNFDPQER